MLSSSNILIRRYKMKKVTMILSVVAMVSSVMISSAEAGWVSGHFRSNGTYVAPYLRSAPDGNPYNNYSY